MNQAEPKVITCLYDFSLWFLQRTNRFPKNWRVTLGDKIDDLLLNMTVKAVIASKRAEKTGLLAELSEQLEAFRILARISKDLGCLDGKQYDSL